MWFIGWILFVATRKYTTIHVSFNLTPLTSVYSMFTYWLREFHRKLKSKIHAGASAICWVIWLTWNDVVFNKVLAPSYLQIIFMETYWIRFSSLLQKEEDRQMMKIWCRKIKATVMEVFARNGWRFSNKIMFQMMLGKLFTLSFFIRTLFLRLPRSLCSYV
jgi:hypothetical protein